MNPHEEDEEEGPSVDSAIAEERIAARRILIQRRLEAAKREASGEDSTKKKPVDSEKDALKSRKQMEDSRQRLVKLKSDGTELVTNVHVAADARESMRRLEEEEQRRQRNEKLEGEAKSATEKFEEITKKWEYALSKEIPQDLHSMLMEQKTACDSMIDEKNKLIHDFQQLTDWCKVPREDVNESSSSTTSTSVKGILRCRIAQKQAQQNKELASKAQNYSTLTSWASTLSSGAPDPTKSFPHVVR